MSTAMRIAWCPIRKYANRYAHQFCEAPRHSGTFRRATHVMVVGPIAEEDASARAIAAADGELFEIQGMCHECIAQIAKEMNMTIAEGEL